MIIDPKTLEAYPEPQDAPPAYDQATTSSSSVPAPAPAEKAPATPTSPTAARLILGAGRGNAASGWLRTFGLGASSKTDRDVKATVLLLVRDLVKAGHSPDAISILQSCAEVCRARSLSLEAILQEPSIEGHTPLYWAILKSTQPQHARDEGQIGLVDLLMSFPLTQECMRDARHACLLSSDDALFQRLRRSPGCTAGSSATDELLLGAPAQDRLAVENAPGDNGAFKVTLHFTHFQKRMRVSKSVRAEFIARGRIWYLSFLIAGQTERYTHATGAWLAAVGLVDAETMSPPTHLDSRLVIQPQQAAAKQADPGWANRIVGAPANAPLVVRLKSSRTMIGEKDYEDGTRRKRAIAPLAASGLEFDGCPHLNPDGSLDAVFEAELSQGGIDSECVVC